MKEDISKILIKWSMPTRQAAIGEIIGYFKKLFGGCEICYGKGYSTTINQYTEGDGSKKWTEDEMMFCKCSRGDQLRKYVKQMKKRWAISVRPLWQQVAKHDNDGDDIDALVKVLRDTA